MDDNYDVFLNHRGPDVKETFAAKLNDALRMKGLNPFLDKISLVKGNPAFTSIDDALKVAKIHVAIVSQGYAESKYCLCELVAMIRSGKPVIPVFYNVEPAHLRRVDTGPFAVAFEKHKTRKRAEQIVEWEEALQKLANITGFCLSDYKGGEVELIQEVVDGVMCLTPTNEALQVESYIVGCVEPINACIHEMEKMQGTTGFLCIVGMGGIGKTTLAKGVYNHVIGQKQFQSMTFLELNSSSYLDMDVGQSMLIRLQKQLLWDLLRVPNNTPRSYQYWFHKLSSRGPVLIVLDNLHDKFEFDELILGIWHLAPRSRIIVTSRDRHLMKVIVGKNNAYHHEVTTLGCHDSEKLFNWHAFHEEEAPKNFKSVAQDVSKGCGGLPLALKVVGSSLFGMTSDEDRQCIWPEAIDALQGDPDVITALKWSYNCLHEPERLMFVDIACVFCGWRKEEVIEIWNSCKKCSSCCGSGTPHMSLRRLVDRSLIVLEESGTILTMHSFLKDMGQDIGMVDGSHLWNAQNTEAIVAKVQGTNKVRALNLAKSKKRKFEAENFTKMSNLHYLILDGCEVSGDLQSVSNELRWLRWRDMPSTHLSTKLNLSNLVSLDFSQSTKLANLWVESNPWLQACPNLARLALKSCTSIKELPDSIRQLPKLKTLDLSLCDNLQKLPTCIGQVTTLQELYLGGCINVEALPHTITQLCELNTLSMMGCSSILKLPTSFGLLKSLDCLCIDLGSVQWQALKNGQFHVLKDLLVSECIDETITLFDSLGTLRYLDQITGFDIWHSPSMTKIPRTIGLLTNLQRLRLWDCEKLQKLPNSIGELKVLRSLKLNTCSTLKTLPDSLGQLENLQVLIILACTSISKLPNCIKYLNRLEVLHVSDCGNLEDLEASTMLHGLRIWGCTSIIKLPGSYLTVVDICYSSGEPHWANFPEIDVFPCMWKESQVFEENDCGSLRLHEDIESGGLRLLRVHKFPCKVR